MQLVIYHQPRRLVYFLLADQNGAAILWGVLKLGDID